MRRRRRIRLFAGLVVLLLLSDTFPQLEQPQPESRLRRWLSPIGLWQGAWSMYAPDPTFRTVRLSAEITLADGALLTWEMPEWTEKSCWDRFVGHRQLNYNNQLDATNGPAYDDFADYLRRAWLPRQADGEADAVELRFVVSELRILPPQDEQFPTADNTGWMSGTQTRRQWDLRP